MRHRVRALQAQLQHAGHALQQAKPFSSVVQAHISQLALRLSQSHTALQQKTFSTSPCHFARNRVQPSIRRPADFLTLLQSASSTNTLLLTLFRTSTCHSCSNITPLLEDIIKNRPVPSVGDTFGSIAFAELELDSPERDDGGGRGWSTMYDVGIEYGVRSVPTLIGFGGRRADRVTDRLADEKSLKDRQFMQQWIDEQMKNGDPNPSSGGLFSKIFGSGS